MSLADGLAWEKENGPMKREIVDQLPPRMMTPGPDREGAEAFGMLIKKAEEMLIKKAEEMRGDKAADEMAIARETDRKNAADLYATAAARKADARVALARANAAAEAAKKAYAEASNEERAALATVLKLDNLADPDEPAPVWRDARDVGRSPHRSYK